MCDGARLQRMYLFICYVYVWLAVVLGKDPHTVPFQFILGT
jgi:hypothetical protein